MRANRFHDFRLGWAVQIARALNGGELPDGYFALLEPNSNPISAERLVTDSEHYSNKSNHIAIYRSDERMVAVIDIVSPGNKESRHAINSFRNKMATLIGRGVHVLVIDLFPPGKHDPDGLHPLIWKDWSVGVDAIPHTKPLALLSYCAVSELAAYIEPVAVGDTLRYACVPCGGSICAVPP